MKINEETALNHRVVLAQVDYPDGVKSIMTIKCSKSQARNMVGKLYSYNKSWFIESVEAVEA